MARPETTAHVRVTQHSWQLGIIAGEVQGGDFVWQFSWRFRGDSAKQTLRERDNLSIEPALGRALIQDALLRFLLKWDYQLEAGGDYTFTVRAKF
jgi:hypothetical protein